MQGLPAPPPSIAYDVNEFRRFFQFGLDQLKYNNKYIINDLTTLASVYHHRMSTYIVKDIEQHIRNSDPSHRLIGFYVLDSICKNLGHPFPQLFKPFIERLFLIAYRDIEDVDPIAKIKFEELLGTWRTGSANQTELFDPDVQRRIEAGVFGNWRRGDDSIASQAFLNGIKQQPAVATPVEKASILYDVRRILAEREQIAAAYPGDQENLSQIVTLQQLDQLIVSQQLTISQVDDIRKRLEPLKATIQLPNSLDSSIPRSHVQQFLPQVLSLPAPTPPPVQQLGDDSLASLARLLETNPNILLEAVQQPTPAPAPAPQPSLVTQHQGTFNFDPAGQLVLNNVPQIAQPSTAVSVPNLEQTLANTNMFNSEQLAAALAYLNPPAANGASTETTTPERPTELNDRLTPGSSTLSHSESGITSHVDLAILEYENKIAALPIQLQNASINRVKAADIADILYSHIPQFCRQDGSRFLYGKIGSQRASEQLDRHFRLQRRVREVGQRAQQRMWAQLESEWLNSHDFGLAGSSETLQDDKKHKKKRKSIDDEKSVSELAKKSIIRPSSPGLASQPCPICQEAFETKFDEDEGEFYWLNAIELTREAGKRSIYHATCHHETIRNKARMRIKSELEENRLKRFQMETERKNRSENGTGNLSNGGVKTEVSPHDDGEVGKRCNNIKAVLGDSTSSGDDGDKCLLQVDETFFGETDESTSFKIKLESDEAHDHPMPSSDPRVQSNADQKPEVLKSILSESSSNNNGGDSASAFLLGKRKSSPMSSSPIDPLVDQSSDHLVDLSPEATFSSKKKSKMS